jgi:hypothetical protein
VNEEAKKGPIPPPNLGLDVDEKEEESFLGLRLNPL